MQSNQDLLNSLPAHIAVIDRYGNIIEVNDAWRTFWRENVPPDSEVVGVGDNYFALIKDAEGPLSETAAKIEAGVRAVSRGDLAQFEFECSCHAFTEKRWFLLHALPFKGKAGAVVVSHTDISRLKQAEQQLEYQASLFRQVSEAIIATDSELRIISWNEAAAEIYGWREAEAVGRPIDDLLKTEWPVVKQHQAQAILNETGSWQGEVIQQHKDGRKIDICASVSWIRDEAGSIVGGVTINRDITQRKQMEESLQQRNRELEFLNRVGQKLVSTLDLDRMLAAVLEETRQLLDVFGCSVWLLEPDTGDLVCSQASAPYNKVALGWKLAPDRGLVSWAARHGRSLLTPDARTDPRHYPQIDERIGVELRSIISAPLRVNREIIGAINVVDTVAHRFSPFDLSLVESLAATMAIAIENARLFDREQQQRQAAEQALAETQLLYRISSILAQTSDMQAAVEQTLGEYLQALALAQGRISLFDPEKQWARLYALVRRGRPDSPSLPIKIMSPLYQKLVDSRRPIAILDARNDPLLSGNREMITLYRIKSSLVVPLLVRGEVVGVLEADATDQPRHFSEREISLGQVVADQIAGAIDRIRLDEQQRRLTAVIEQATETIVITDTAGNIVYANPYFETSSGYSLAEAMGQNPNILQSGLHDPDFYREMWDTISAGNTWQGALINKRKDGARYYEEASIFPIKNAAGEIINYAAVKRDITERIQAEEKLRQSEEKFRGFFEQSHDGIRLVDANGNIIAWNKAMERITGVKAADVLGRPTWDITFKMMPAEKKSPAGYNRIKSEVLDMLHNADAVWLNSSAEYDLQRPDGTRRTVQISIFAIETEQGVMLGSTFRDITERKQAEEQLRLLAAAIESTGEGVMITDNQLDWPGPKIVFVNRGMGLMSGYSREELVGQTPRILQGPGNNDDIRPKLKETLVQGEMFEGETINYRKDGSSYRVALRISPVFNDLEQITHYVALVQDVTKIRALESQLRQSQRLEAIGRLAGGVAHDFNNILTVITSHVEFLLMLYPDVTHPVRRDVDPIKRAATRATDLIRQLLAFSRLQVLQPQNLNLNELVADLERLLDRLIRKDIELKTRLAPQLEPIYADPGQIEQVIMNLVVNARDAMPNGGQLTIETAGVYLDTPPALHSDEFEAGPHIRLTVRDTGAGMDAATRERIFEPFFTTKPEGEGTGLGLATVHGIVTQSKGCLAVESELGQGTSVSIYLPRVKKTETTPTKPKQSGVVIEPGTETILLVEDEADVRDVIYEALLGRGYTVLAAADGAEALRMSEEYQGKIHLLLTDVVMPGEVDGVDLAQTLSARRPDMRTIYMSGYAEEIALHQHNIDADYFLQKPFAPVDLIVAVQSVLDNPSSVND